jgi:opacity protein-like surface antigen
MEELTMKRVGLLFVILTIVFLAIPLMAQTQLGIIGGINIANISGDVLDENNQKQSLSTSSRTAFGIGGVLDLALSENVSLRFEPMYLQKGAKDEEEVEGVTVTEKYKFTYIEVPAFIKIAFGTSNTRPYIMAGPSLGFLLSADLEFDIMGISASTDLKDAMSSTDFGLGFGGGVNFQLETLSIFLEARYALGLSDVFTGGTLTILGMTEEVPDEALDIKTNGIQIMGGITFPLGQ